MKLRYLGLKNYGPLKDVDVVFSASSPLNRACSIRFVVGVNGSGKTHLLKALSEVFIALADWQPPHFPVTLIFELGEERPVFTLDSSQLSSDHVLGGSTARTIILDSPGKKKDASLWIFDSKLPDDTDFKAVLKALNNKNLNNRNFRPIIPRGEWTGKSSTPNLGYLPKAVLAYTTGAPESWEKLWLPRADSEGADTLSHDLEYKWEDNERPLGWNIWQERSLNFASGSFVQEVPTDEEKGAWQPLLLDKQKLKCALLAVTLPHTIEKLERITQEDLKSAYLEELRSQGESMSGLDGLLARGGWAWPVAVSVKQDSKIGGEIARHERQNFKLKLDWLSHATQVIPDPYPGKLRTLWFDMGGDTKPIKSSEADAHDEDAYPSGAATLLKLLGGAGSSAFERFEQLLDLLDRGVISDLNIMLRKIDHDDLLNFDELSDGEQMVLCRMALFHLLEGQKDVLLLLDEPETHFNDKWKRDVVDIIDSAIGDTTNEVVISTHASLVLTDALKDEIILMKPVFDKGSRVFPLGDDVHTFGATSDHPLRDVFGAHDTVGRRASKLLEVLLAAAAHAESVEALWADKLSSEDKAKVVSAVLATTSATEEGLDEKIVTNCLEVAARFVESAEEQKPLKMINVLESFIEQTGPGYFRVELMRAWRRLKEGKPNAA